ncbi:MAG: tRNA (adenosine(37)-N6)-dimethylallyltransferase MiaA [Candidatus Merdivicinus sp.]|jgi:tRNA dimethylallyltransferase
MKDQKPVVAVMGPTASGKTALSIALAKNFDGEVVSADSMQIYKGMDIATAKPTPEEMDGIPHHLIGYVEPDEPYSLGRYVEDARRAIAEIHSRGKLPILCGGTGLYLDTLLDNRDIGETGSDPAVRAELSALAEEKGSEYLLSLLREFDPETASNLHPNNLTRIIRAIEVYRLSGITMAELQRKSRETQPIYSALRIGIAYHNRETLYQRINRRVDLMLEQGLLEETRHFVDAKLSTSVQAIGYKELFPFLRGEIPLETAVESLKQSTRRYAKRQLTWFRRDDRIYWVYPDDPRQISAYVTAERLVNRFLSGENLEKTQPLDEK